MGILPEIVAKIDGILDAKIDPELSEIMSHEYKQLYTN